MCRLVWLSVKKANWCEEEGEGLSGIAKNPDSAMENPWLLRHMFFLNFCEFSYMELLS